MKTSGFLDQLLKTAQQSLGGGTSGSTSTGLGGLLGSSGGGLGGLIGSVTGGALSTQDKSGTRGSSGRGLLNADFGKGALTGGALGLLLGNRKVRKAGGKIALYGGVAAVGLLAYKAYGDYRRQQGDTDVQPQTVDRLPEAEAELHAQAILRALVAAAKADGHIDSEERAAIEGEFTRLDSDASLRDWLHAELEKPLDPAEVARAATTPEMASEMYLASLLAADEQSYMERAYLDELARQLKIDDALKARLEQQVIAAGDAPAA